MKGRIDQGTYGGELPAKILAELIDKLEDPTPKRKVKRQVGIIITKFSTGMKQIALMTDVKIIHEFEELWYRNSRQRVLNSDLWKNHEKIGTYVLNVLHIRWKQHNSGGRPK